MRPSFLIYLRFACCCCIWSGGVMTIHGQSERLRVEIAKLIKYETTIDFDLVPGILVGVIDGDSTYICSYGQPLSADSIYELGSVTQPVVAWLAMQALDSLNYSPDNPVCVFLPDSLCQDQWANLSTSGILSHQGGLERFPVSIGLGQADIKDPYAAYTREMLAKDIMKTNPGPGIYSYSHFGYSVLSWLFDRVGGLDGFAEARLFSPLHIEHTSWNSGDKQIAQGHGIDGAEYGPWHVNSLAPSLGLKSSMHDLLLLVDFFCMAMDEKLPEWNKQNIREQKQYEKQGNRKLLEGWYLTTSSDDWLCYHEGRTGGHHVSVAFQPRRNKAVIVVSNGTIGTGQLCFLIMDMISRA